MTAPLTGLLVADFSRVLAGPLATMTIADLGATVVRVERPGSGDDTRTWGPPWTSSGTSSYFYGVNRSKYSVALDLDDDADRAIAGELAARAERYGLDPLVRPDAGEPAQIRHPVRYAHSSVAPAVVPPTPGEHAELVRHRLAGRSDVPLGHPSTQLQRGTPR